MPQQREFAGRSAAELLLRLCRAALGEGFVEQLTSAQWMALRYFSRANRFSRTVSAFAAFHATTRGTASQTVKGLVEQGYLVRTRSVTDGRSARVDLTDKAKAILVHDPVEVVVAAADALPARHRAQLVKVLERMLAHVARERGRAHFGVCSACAHLRSGDGRGSRRQSHQCGLLNEPLSPEETGQVCISFEPVQTRLARRNITRRRTP